MIGRLRHQTREEDYYSVEMQEFVKKYKEILIMGTGEYSSILTRQFENNNINFAGYVISHKNSDHTNEFMGKPVWILGEMPFPKADVGIVIAINPKDWKGITDSLMEAGIENYYCPYLLDANTDQTY